MGNANGNEPKRWQKFVFALGVMGLSAFMVGEEQCGTGCLRQSLPDGWVELAVFVTLSFIGGNAAVHGVKAWRDAKVNGGEGSA